VTSGFASNPPKESGSGKDMSIYSMEEYTQINYVAFKID
jgi:hypothetical protein